MADSTKINKPLDGKRFFIDPKLDKTVANKVKQNLMLLGGVVEEFLDRNIHFAISSEENVKSMSTSKNTSNSVACSPFNTSAPSPQGQPSKSAYGGRWKNVAKRANVNQSSAGVMETAKKLGIKIRLVGEVLQWLLKKTGDLQSNDKKIPVRPMEIILKHPCIKIEDLKHKPYYEEMDAVSVLTFEASKNRCPFVNPAEKLFSEKPNKKKNNQLKHQKGFCECCQCSYLSESQHCKSVQHLNYGEKSGNYRKFDTFVNDSCLDLSTFLKRAQRAADRRKCDKDLQSSVSDLSGSVVQGSALTKNDMSSSPVSTNKPSVSPSRKTRRRKTLSPLKRPVVVFNPSRVLRVRVNSLSNDRKSLGNSEVPYRAADIETTNEFVAESKTPGSVENLQQKSNNMISVDKSFGRPDACAEQTERLTRRLTSLNSGPRLKQFTPGNLDAKNLNHPTTNPSKSLEAKLTSSPKPVLSPRRGSPRRCKIAALEKLHASQKNVKDSSESDYVEDNVFPPESLACKTRKKSKKCLDVECFDKLEETCRPRLRSETLAACGSPTIATAPVSISELTSPAAKSSPSPQKRSKEPLAGCRSQLKKEHSRAGLATPKSPVLSPKSRRNGAKRRRSCEATLQGYKFRSPRESLRSQTRAVREILTETMPTERSCSSDDLLQLLHSSNRDVSEVTFLGF